MIFEVAGALRLAGTSHADPYRGSEKDLTEWVAWNVGYMRNRDSTHALGWMLTGGGSGGGTRVSLQARRRTWLTRQFTFDVSGGPLLAQQQSADLSGTKQGYGLTAEASLGALDLAGITLAGDLIHVQNRTPVAVYVGAKAGSHLAVAGSVVALLGTIALYKALSGGL